MLSVPIRSTMDERIAYNAVLQAVRRYDPNRRILPLLTFSAFQNYLGMDEKEFADAVISLALYGNGYVPFESRIFIDPTMITIRFDSDDKETAEGRGKLDEFELYSPPYPDFKNQSIDFPGLHPKLKRYLIKQVCNAASELQASQPGYNLTAGDNADRILEVMGYDGAFDLLNTDWENIVDCIRLINLILFENFTKLLELIGKTPSDIAEELFVPVRTVNGWCTGSDCKPYIRLLIAEKYGLI